MSPRLRDLAGLWSRPQLPADVRSALRGSRPLAAARADDGTWLVGTRRRLHSVGATADSWGWETVLRADWDEDDRRLTVVPVADYGRPVERRAYVLEEAADLLTLVRERVSASIVLQRRVDVSGRQGFRVFARRPPTGGPIVWAFELDPDVDPRDPAVRTAMDAALAEAQSSLGVSEA